MTIDDMPMTDSREPDVPLGSLIRFESVGFPNPNAIAPPPLAPPTEETAALDQWELGALSVEPVPSIEPAPVHPDVPLASLIAFEKVELPGTAETDGEGATARSAFRATMIFEWAESLAMVVAFILVFTGYVAQATQVPTGSMKPTILVGDHFFIEKLAFPGNYPAAVRPFLPTRAVRRGDIIVFRSPIDGRIPFVKRVIGAPGDRLEIRAKEVFVNGVKLDEPYKIHIDTRVFTNDGFVTESDKKRDNFGPEVIPPDKFFVMGDNRDDSNDSRFWGYVGRDAIMGRPLFVYWSYKADLYSGTPPTLSERLNDYVSTGVHFFSRTRWFRFGALVQ